MAVVKRTRVAGVPFSVLKAMNDHFTFLLPLFSPRWTVAVAVRFY